MWEVIGFEVNSNTEGAVTGYTMYCTKPFKGQTGKGKLAKRFWYRASIPYVPNIGDKVFVEVSVRNGQGGKQFEVIDDIYKM